MASDILTIIILIPLYGVSALMYFYPRESMLFGRRWTFKEEPHFSEGAIRFTKFLSIIFIFLITIFFVSPIFDSQMLDIFLFLALLIYIGISGFKLL